MRLDEQGGVAGVDVDGQLHPNDFVEETPGKPALVPSEDETGVMKFSSGH